MFNQNIFWAAFGRAGMLVDAVYQPTSGPAGAVKVGFVEPDVLLMSEMVQAAQTRIEYETATMPDLKNGESITIGTDAYKVRGIPQKKGDGFFSTVELIKQ